MKRSKPALAIVGWALEVNLIDCILPIVVGGECEFFHEEVPTVFFANHNHGACVVESIIVIENVVVGEVCHECRGVKGP